MSKLFLICLLSLISSSIFAQNTVTTTTVSNGNNETTTTNGTNTTTTTQPVNSTLDINQTVITDSSQIGQSVVITTPLDQTTGLPGTSTNTTITYQQLNALETATGPENITTYPTQNYTLYLADIHFISGNLSAQYIAHHFCHFVNEDFMQCALFNDTTPNARFIGNEYFITKALFDTLSDDERTLWHSHPYEVQSGLFVAPDLTPEDELIVMEWLMGTFGKVADTWSFFDSFPFGHPKLGMALALDSQVDWDVADLMDQQLNLSTTHQERRQQRADFIAPPATPGADNYLVTGNATQYQVYQIMLDNNGRTLPDADDGTR